MNNDQVLTRESDVSDVSCGSSNWTAYKDEKCLGYFGSEGGLTFDEAEKLCRSQDGQGSLVYIKSDDEQKFVSNLLYVENKVVDNVWIGATITLSDMAIKWRDDSPALYTDWDENNPQNKTDFNCVQQNPDSSPPGKWENVHCTKKNYVLCQKMQILSLSQLQKSFIDARKQLNDRVKALEENHIPIGFIYVQLADQDIPASIWPQFNWSDVTTRYTAQVFQANPVIPPTTPAPTSSYELHSTRNGFMCKTNTTIDQGDSNEAYLVVNLWKRIE